MDANDVTFTRFVPARVVSLAQASASTKQRIASALDQEEEEEAGAGAGTGTAGNKRSPGGGDPLSNNPGKGSGETRDSKWARARERERERDRNDREERRRDRDHHYRGGGGGGGGGGRGGGGGGGRRYRSRSRSRSPDPRRRERRGGDRGGGDKRSPRDPEEIQRQKEEQRAKAAERDARTVFATNLSTRADERDLFEFFSVAGDVMDVRVIMDRLSRRSKGRAYIEYETREGAASALALSGSSFLGQTVQVRGSESEKNLAWESEKREKKAAAATAAVEAGGTAAGGGAAATATGDMETAGAPGSAARLKSGKLDIANIDPKLTVDKLRTLFDPFGTLEDLTLTLTPDGTAASGTVVYASPEDAERAIGSLNGMSLRNRQLIVAAAIEMTNTAPPMPQPHMNQLAGAALQTAAAAAAASAAATSVEVAAAAEAAASDAKQNTKMVEQLEERDGTLHMLSFGFCLFFGRVGEENEAISIQKMPLLWVAKLK